MPAQLPNETELETLRTRLRNAIDGNIHEVLGTADDGVPLIGHDGRETLIRLHESPAAAAEFVTWAHGYARNAGWEALRIRRELNFRPYAQEFTRRTDAARAQTAQARAALRGMRVVAGGRRDQPPPEDAQGAMAPAEMVESDSLFLIAVGTLLQRRRGRVWFDDFHKRYMTNWSGAATDTVITDRTRSDSFDLNVYSWLQQIDHRLAKFSLSNCASAISHVADQDTRNVAADWLNGLQWDGVDRLTNMLPEAFKTDDDDYHRAVGRCWFISMAARILDPGCKVDTMPVFIGPQGWRKSQALEVIGGQWYRTASSSIDNANFLMEIHGALVFEIQELHSIVSGRQSTAKIKAVLSTRIDNFRVPYGRHVGEHRRTAVIVGTTNEGGWHNDSTGGRRFWPAHVKDMVDLEWLRLNRDQLFAEAAHLYREHMPWWDVPEEDQIRRIEAERHIDPWEDIIRSRVTDPGLVNGHNNVRRLRGDGGLSETADFGSLITLQRIGIQWLRLTPEQLSRSSRKLSDVMRSLGWVTTQGRVEDWPNPVRFWVRAERPEADSCNAPVTDGEEVTARLDENVPF